MKYEFDFQMDEKTLADFYMNYTFIGGAGFIWPILGVLALFFALFSTTAPAAYRLIYGIFGLVFIAYIPWDLYAKAKKQLKKNPYYANPIHYIIDEEGVTTIQGEQEAKVAWDYFSKIKKTKNSTFLYMRNKNACILSNSVFGDDFDAAYDWLKTKVLQK